MNQTHQLIRIVELKSQAIMFTCIAVATILVCSYVGLVYTTVMNAVAKEKIEIEIASLNSTLGEKEFEYISKKGAVTVDLAASLGFVSATNKTSFVTLARPAENVAIR